MQQYDNSKLVTVKCGDRSLWASRRRVRDTMVRTPYSVLGTP